MLDKIKQAYRMARQGATHGEVKEVTGLSHEVELAATEFGALPETVYARLPKIKPGMKYDEIRKIVTE